MPAGTKLIAGNKPVSFVTAQQFQQLQQQGQATQVHLHVTNEKIFLRKGKMLFITSIQFTTSKWVLMWFTVQYKPL